ncbi:hypothetical protein J057_03635 [Marinobacter nanhaiticus D15-8W]|uniref:Uncharacterized protein n=1 Tax=Marinobacter nanhaiticus D15-8W TaxID=626887 RepID=N6W2K6_9GAMM|nr:hypothetical protein J057_03635 [Marinobacter nanhaiticus D15-8W]
MQVFKGFCEGLVIFSGRRVGAEANDHRRLKRMTTAAFGALEGHPWPAMALGDILVPCFSDGGHSLRFGLW